MLAISVDNIRGAPKTNFRFVLGAPLTMAPVLIALGVRRPSIRIMSLSLKTRQSIYIVASTLREALMEKKR